MLRDAHKFVIFGMLTTTLALSAETRLTKNDVLRRTKILLKRECALSITPLSTDKLNDLGCGDERSLAFPINNIDFADVNAKIRIWDLHGVGDKTVSDLRDIILNHIER